MKRSTDHILTTHVGSLIRPPALLEFLAARRDGKEVDAAAHAKCLTESVAEIVAEQAAAGIDVVSDGEFGKSISWSLYALNRLSGFERRRVPTGGEEPFARGADRERFADFYAEMDAGDDRRGRRDTQNYRDDMVCVGPIEYANLSEVETDIANLKAAIEKTQVTEAFLPVAAPASVIPDRKNEYYATDEECVVAIAEAMRVEYKAIVDAGFIVQVDDARAAVTYDRMVPPASFDEYHKWVARHMELLNHALEGIPEEMVRYHVCWGSWPGPHTTDVPLKDIVDLVLSVKAGAYVIEGANPRHEHEWKVWRDVKLPDGKILIPGVVSHATNVVEHPELVAERVVRLAELVGRENVIAGTDCGFAQGPFHQRVHPSIMWAKLEALAEGAALASKELF